eukprot:scaffold60253_cov29-Tisochrysis_lutea.AAC.1
MQVLLGANDQLELSVLNFVAYGVVAKGIIERDDGHRLRVGAQPRERPLLRIGRVDTNAVSRLEAERAQPCACSLCSLVGLGVVDPLEGALAQRDALAHAVVLWVPLRRVFEEGPDVGVLSTHLALSRHRIPADPATREPFACDGRVLGRLVRVEHGQLAPILEDRRGRFGVEVGSGVSPFISVLRVFFSAQPHLSDRACFLKRSAGEEEEEGGSDTLGVT